MSAFRVWDPSEETEEFGLEIVAFDEVDAAEQYAESLADIEAIEVRQFEVKVRAPDSEPVVVHIDVEWEPSFHGWRAV